jgi:hypothetical protein
MTREECNNNHHTSSSIISNIISIKEGSNNKIDITIRGKTDTSIQRDMKAEVMSGVKGMALEEVLLFQ